MSISPSGKPATVLLVDDDPVGRLALGEALRRAGFDVREAAAGREALEMAAAAAPDLAVLDVHLPGGLSGLDVCRELKARPATAPLPVLMISAVRIAAEDRVSGLECGADAYLTKPVEPAEVVAHLKALLRRGRAQRRERAARRRAEGATARLAAILGSSEDAIIGMDLDGAITIWNRAAERLFGYAAGEIVGRPVAVLVPPDRADEVGDMLARARRGEGGKPFETARLRKDGTAVDVSLSCSPVRDRRGRVVGAAKFVRDVSVRRRLEEQVRQAQKMEAVGRLAAGVAHDFNNLLTVISGCGHVVLRELPADSPSRPHVAEIVKAGERGAALIRQLLALGRSPAAAPADLHLNAVVADMEKMLRRLLGEGIDLVTRLQPGLGRVRADRGQVEQVLLNLAANARDAMPHGGRVTVETGDVELGEGHAGSPAGARPGPHVLLAVSDTGCGMTAEVKARVFEPFFTTKGDKGTGLGLATVYGAVRQSGGHIEVYSEPGVGTTFRLYLPRGAGEPR